MGGLDHQVKSQARAGLHYHSLRDLTVNAYTTFPELIGHTLSMKHSVLHISRKRFWLSTGPSMQFRERFGFLEGGGGYSSKCRKGGRYRGGPALGPMLKSLQRRPEGGPDPKPPLDPHRSAFCGNTSSCRFC